MDDSAIVDAAAWHSASSRFSSELHPDDAATHIGMWLAWLVNHQLMRPAGRLPDDLLVRLRFQEVTGRDVLLSAMEGELRWDDLSEAGRAFCDEYFQSGRFFRDYEATLASNLPSQYHVEDTWTNYDLIAPVILRAHLDWRRHGPRRWWQFWRR